jgi:hypothetical protein
MIYEYGEPQWNDIDRGKPNNSKKSLSNATLSPTDPTWTEPGTDD